MGNKAKGTYDEYYSPHYGDLSVPDRLCRQGC